MASTYLSLHYHIVFGTKNRLPSLDAKWRPRLYDYLGGIVHRLGGFSKRIGGIDDHVHLLVSLKATHNLADLMLELKKSSSVWVHDTLGEKHFAWQEGYAAFTVSATPLGSGCFLRFIRGCRYAQPPANGLNPVGVPHAQAITCV